MVLLCGIYEEVLCEGCNMVKVVEMYSIVVFLLLVLDSVLVVGINSLHF